MIASYERLGVGYAQRRRADPRWQAAIHAVVGEAATVLNVGAGTGSYGRFDVAMALVTLHHWADWRKGLREMRRVAARVVVVHFDPFLHSDFWLARDYLPELTEVWRDVPTPEAVAAALSDGARITTLPVPWDCVDGFLPAYWRRPEAYLDPAVRRSMSGLQLLAPEVLRRGVEALRLDLDSGTWRRRNADLLERDELDVGWRLIAS